MTARALAALALLAAACAPRVDPRLVKQPIASRTWVSPLHRDHPLVGRIWDVRAGRFLDEAALDAALVRARFVLLGEVHDNVDHHLLQARLLRALTSAGRRPAVAFEMLTADQQPEVDAAIARAPRDPDALAKAVKRSGWDFALYRPIFAVAREAGLPIVAANLPRTEVRGIVSKGAEAIDPALRARLARDEPLPPTVEEALRAEMRESHCGELPEAMLDPLVLAQRARDARMAERLADGGGDGAVLIAGKGHARTDRGVPAVLAEDRPGASILAVGFVEVDPAVTAPAGYHEDAGTGPLPYDYAIFTPGAEREDPCEGLREHARKRAEKRAAPDEAPSGADSTRY